MTIRALPRPRTFDDVVNQLMELRGDVGLLRSSVAALAEQQGAFMRALSALPPYRDPDASFHDFDPLVAEFRKTLKERVKDETRFDSERARAIAQDAIKLARLDDKAAAYDALKKTVLRVLVGIVVGVIVAMTLAHFGLHP